jgi:hypothetical protein
LALRCRLGFDADQLVAIYGLTAIRLSTLVTPGASQAARSASSRSDEEIKPDPANPRRHSKKQIRQIAHSITVFGFNVPILIDRDNNVIAGHGRLEACRELGWSRVPTLCLDHLTVAQAREDSSRINASVGSSVSSRFIPLA